MLKIFIETLKLFGPLMDHGRALHARIIGGTFLCLAVLITLGWLLNIVGLKGANIFIGLALVVSGVILATRPEPLSIILAGGITDGIIVPETVSAQIISWAKKYVRVMSGIIMACALMFLILATVPFGDNPGLFWGLLLAVIIIGLAMVFWPSPTCYSKKFVYGYTIAILILFILQLVPAHVYKNMTGYDLKGWLEEDRAAKALSVLEKTQAEKIADSDVAIISSLASKINSGYALTEAEKNWIAEYKKRRDAETLPAKIRNAVGNISLPSVSSASANYAPATYSPTVAQVAPAAPAPVAYAPTPAVQIPTQAVNPSCSDKNIGTWEGKIDGVTGVIPVTITRKCTGELEMQQFKYGDAYFRLDKSAGTLEGTWEASRPEKLGGKIRLVESGGTISGEIENGSGTWLPVTFRRV